MDAGDQPTHELTALFGAIQNGDEKAENQLFELVYSELATSDSILHCR